MAAPRSEGGPRGRSRTPRDTEWIPTTKLGMLVKQGKITSLEEIFKSSLRIQEAGIVDHLLGRGALCEEVLSVSSVQKQSKAGQRTSIKVVAIVGDKNGRIGLGTHSSKDMNTSVLGAISKAKIGLIPVQLGQWDGAGGVKHTVVARASGKCGSTIVKVIPAPVGTGTEVCDVHRKIFELAGVQDIIVNSYGRTKTTENLAKATIKALENSSNMYTPEQWNATEKIMNPIVANAEVFSQFNKIALN